MCRMVVFAGTCPACNTYFTWNELSQELSCLEAKNNGIFGDCRRGMTMEEHVFNQECDECAEEANNDEGVAGLEDDNMLTPATRSKSTSGGKASSSSKKDDSRKKKKQRTA
jgi:hypothetical protein